MAIWLLVIVAVPVVLVIAVVLLPLRLRLRGQADRRSRVRLDVSVLGGVIPAIPVVDTARKSKRQSTGSDKRKPVRKAKSASRLAEGDVVRLIVELIRQIRIVWIRVEAEIGLDDPADTGALYGALAPIIHTGRHWAGFNLDIRPDFSGTRLAGKIDAAVDLVPVRLVPPLWRYASRNIFRSRT
ncbi:MAG: DUF2953 domain-containing protein [Alphaproteobacteria bacterium]|nr:DUF2953 domain-containing protein [Alphaproteobacteria bacterium]